MFVNYKTLAVYQLEQVEHWNDTLSIPSGLQWAYATTDSVKEFFGDDPKRKRTFLQFLDKDYCGIIVNDGAQWVNYGWISKPNTLGPPHLPRSIQRNPVYWLFYQHTRVEYRGRGYYKMALKIQITCVREQNPVANLYIDARVDNVASRRGIISVGFRPRGLIYASQIRIPKIKPWVWGYWDTDAKHPRLDGGEPVGS